VVEPWCIGCVLCVPPCPVDCIAMVPARGEWNAALKRAAGERGKRRLARIRTTGLGARDLDRKRILAEALQRKNRA
jgi:Na+-translocating ferredoxin:NAD+ oxidoreductase RNF subunit RnfB